MMSRPNKHMRNTPEKEEPCQIKIVPAGKVKIAENENACPDNRLERTHSQAEARSQKGDEESLMLNRNSWQGRKGVSLCCQV